MATKEKTTRETVRAAVVDRIPPQAIDAEVAVIGAMVGELTVHNRMAQGTKVGFFSMLGFVIGMAAKMAIAFAMTALLLTSVVCSGPRAQVEDEPTTVEPTACLPIEYPLDLGRAGSGPLVFDLHQLDFLVPL